VPLGVDCVSPARHSAFSTPVELMHFIATLRELSGYKPVGFKLCIGHAWEFMAICKAMVETGIAPDFVVIDGSEGGPARRRSNSSITSARRCVKDWSWRTIVWSAPGCVRPSGWGRAGA
jgi:glutamate synthase domain-containing protein 2